MKRNPIVLLLLLLFIPGFSQKKQKFDFGGRFTPAIKKEKLHEAKLISNIMPEFSSHFILSHNERVQFDRQLAMINSSQGKYIYPVQSFYQNENYEKMMDYISIEISGSYNGKVLTSRGKGKILTPEQKNILNIVDPGTELSVKIKFKYKYPTIEFPGSENQIREGKYIITVVPETEAEYPGGFKQMTNYLIKNVIDKIPETISYEKILQAVVKFTVNEEGQVVDCKISRTSSDAKTDKLILDAMIKMPKWSPAKNTNGIKIKEAFRIPFGGGGC